MSHLFTYIYIYIHTSESYHIYDRAVSHLWARHIKFMNESFHSTPYNRQQVLYGCDKRIGEAKARRFDRKKKSIFNSPMPSLGFSESCFSTPPTLPPRTCTELESCHAYECACVWHVCRAVGSFLLSRITSYITEKRGGWGRGGGTGGRRRLWCRLPARYRDMTHWYVWHALSTWVTWPICM